MNLDGKKNLISIIDALQLSRSDKKILLKVSMKFDKYLNNENLTNSRYYESIESFLKNTRFVSSPVNLYLLEKNNSIVSYSPDSKNANKEYTFTSAMISYCIASAHPNVSNLERKTIANHISNKLNKHRNNHLDIVYSIMEYAKYVSGLEFTN